MKKLILLLVLCLQISGYGQGLLNNLRACYPLDCDQCANSASTGATYNGVNNLNVSCTAGHNNAPNTGYWFLGNSGCNFTIPNTTLLKPTTEITISGWFQLNALPTTNCYLVYTNSGCMGAEAAYGLQIQYTTSGLKFQGTKASCFPNSINGAQSSYVFSLNTWNHVVLYISNSVIRITVNNSVTDSTIINSPFTYMNGKPIVLGGTNETGLNSVFNGKMDNLRFWDRRLTSVEITDVYSNDPLCNSVGANYNPTPPPPPVIGNNCGSPLNALASNFQMPLNNFNYNFTNNANTTGKVLIGKTACGTGIARLHVEDDNLGNGIYGFSSITTGNNIGVRGAAGINSSNAMITSVGTMGEAFINTIPGSGAAGVAGFCGSSNLTFLPPNRDIGVYGNSIANGGAFAGYFDGDVQFNGIVWGSQNMWGSDKRLKKNVKELQDISSKLKLLNGYTYQYNYEEFKKRNFPKTEQIGFLAQELQEVFPQLVAEDKDGYLGVNYVGFIPVLLQAHKEQQEKIESQSDAISQLQKQIDELKAAMSAAGANGKNAKTTGLTVVLGDRDAIVLDQNVPNPFAERTTINYNLPGNFNKAEIIFTTEDGHVIKTVIISAKGQGTLNVFANDLSHGVYTYTLVVDGVSVASRKLIKE